jgi:hypothetical protein
MERTKERLARKFNRWRTSRSAQVVVGIGLILHGLGHAVFPLRGAGSNANWTIAKVVVEMAWIVAMTGFVAGGCGLAGARLLRPFWRPLTAIAGASSFIAFATMRRVDLLPGLIFDVLALSAFYTWSNEGRAGTVLPMSTSTLWRRFLYAAGNLSALILTGYVATSAFTRSWHSQWGVTDEELALAFPGDAADRDPAFEVNHGITIERSPAMVWPWILQLGQDRAGFYSYDWLENMFGLRIQNADRIHAEWQRRAVGDLVRAAPPDWLGGRVGSNLGWRITHVEPERALVLSWWGAFVLVPTSENRTRLFVRSKVSDPKVPVWGAALSFATFELPHFIMERQMLRGIKARAESQFEPAPATPSGSALADR